MDQCDKIIKEYTIDLIKIILFWSKNKFYLTAFDFINGKCSKPFHLKIFDEIQEELIDTILKNDVKLLEKSHLFISLEFVGMKTPIKLIYSEKEESPYSDKIMSNDDSSSQLETLRLELITLNKKYQLLEKNLEKIPIIQSGIEYRNNEMQGFVLHEGTGMRYDEIKVTFKTQFNTKPDVVVPVRGGGMDKFDIWFDVVDITTSGFTYRATTWKTVDCYGAYWIAHGF